MNYHIPDALDVAVAHHTRLGGRRADEMLGIQKMPFGYALIICADETYFNWLRYDDGKTGMGEKTGLWMLPRIRALHGLPPRSPSRSGNRS